MSRTPVGEIRPSQLLWTYGPGALIDLPNMSVVTMGIDRWEKDRCQPIQEARLLASVRSVLGPQVDSLRMPPMGERDIVDPFSGAALIAVPVKAFPRWLRCVKCQLLSPIDSGLFTPKVDRYRPENTRFIHAQCRGWQNDQRPRDADAVPARLLLACRAGYIDDFPWDWFIHGGPASCKSTLRFFETGASLQTENLWVKCDGCGASKNMAQAFGQAGRENLPGCRGRHPHIDRFEDDCTEDPRAILLGATNGWFPVTLSVLAIPQTGSPLAQLIADGWTFFEDVGSAAEVAFVVKTLKKTAQLPGIEQFTDEQIWAAIETHRNGGSAVEQSDLKGPEWDVLTADNPSTDYPNFMSKKVDIPLGFEWSITRVLLLERLREVNALLGFTRVESPDEGTGDEAAPRAPLARAAPNWASATQVHGEGIFIRFNADALKAWADKDPVKALDAQLRQGHRGWRQKRNLDPNAAYPEIRYVMLHTLAHMLIRELALECGYNAASIRERVYADVDGGREQAGFLIYTAAADSDGTLGGLVELGKPENLGRLLRQALDRAHICASDPLCAEHDPSKDQSLHGAACRACSFVSETSCERGNRHLDRSLVVPTPRKPRCSVLRDRLMEAMLIAATDLVALLSPSRIEALADRFRGSLLAARDGSLNQLVTTPTARAALYRLIAAWRQTEIPGDVLAGILVGAAYARQQAQRESSVELVWTGPTTPFVATRRTEQVLLDLIHHAQSDLFLVSFVAYQVSSVVDALNAAATCGIEVRMLLETSASQGGSLSVDPVATMRRCVPLAAFYVWTDRPAPFAEGRVHAKVAVADGNAAFLTSANLTGDAIEKNMEAGVVIRGGHIPTGLRGHLHALIETKVIRRI